MEFPTLLSITALGISLIGVYYARLSAQAAARSANYVKEQTEILSEEHRAKESELLYFDEQRNQEADPIFRSGGGDSDAKSIGLDVKTISLVRAINPASKLEAESAGEYKLSLVALPGGDSKHEFFKLVFEGVAGKSMKELPFYLCYFNKHNAYRRRLVKIEGSNVVEVTKH